MKFAPWISTLALAGLLLGIQLGLMPILTLEMGPIPALLPDRRLQAVLCILVFGFGLVIAYKPKNPVRASSVWRCILRSTLVSAVAAGFLFEFGALLRFSSLPPKGSSELGFSLLVFGLAWHFSFLAFLSEALEQKRFLKQVVCPQLPAGSQAITSRSRLCGLCAFVLILFTRQK